MLMGRNRAAGLFAARCRGTCDGVWMGGGFVSICDLAWSREEARNCPCGWRVVRGGREKKYARTRKEGSAVPAKIERSVSDCKEYKLELGYWQLIMLWVDQSRSEWG